MNPFDVLGVSRNASPKEIKKAFKELSFKYSPDRNPDDKEAEKKFISIQEAYSKLTNTQVRKRGRTVYTTVTITFIEAAIGCKKPITFYKTNCKSCNGSGACDMVSCNTCGGRGYATQSFGFTTITTTCMMCRGSGIHSCKKCPDCSDGFDKTASVVEITIPAGIKNKDNITIKKQGESGEIPGDVIVQIVVEDHPLFYRKNDDLIVSKKIHFAQAVFGDTISVPTIDEEIEVVIPQENQNKEIRIKNKGLTNVHTKRKGDLVVHLDIDTKMPNEEGQELLKRLHEASRLDSSVETQF